MSFHTMRIYDALLALGKEEKHGSLKSLITDAVLKALSYNVVDDIKSEDGYCTMVVNEQMTFFTDQLEAIDCLVSALTVSGTLTLPFSKGPIKLDKLEILAAYEEAVLSKVDIEQDGNHFKITQYDNSVQTICKEGYLEDTLMYVLEGKIR